MKRHQSILYVVIVVLIVGIFILLDNKTTIGPPNDSPDKKINVATSTESINSSDIIKLGNKTEKQVAVKRLLGIEKPLSKQELYNQTYAVFEWQTEHYGYYYSGVLSSDYDSYDLEALIELGKQGDMRALDMLGWKYRQQGNDEAALSAYSDAAILGSTSALREIARLTGRKKESREKVLHTLSYLQTAVLRGDQQALASSEVQMKFLNDYYPKLTPVEIKNIQQQGRSRYLDLESKRKKRGLSPFDNSIPEFTRKFYSKARKLIGSNLPPVEESVFITSVK